MKMPKGEPSWPPLARARGARKNCTLARLSLLAGEHVRWSTPNPLNLRENERAEPIRVRKVEEPTMHSLTRKVEPHLVEAPLLPIPAALLVGLLALNVVSALLALLAA